METSAIPNTVICHYRIKEGHLDEMLDLIREHRRVQVDLGWVTDEPERVYVGADQDGSGPYVLAIFQWADAEAAGRAHAHPQVAAIWEKMGNHVEDRAGGPGMQFPHFETRITL